MGKLRSFVIVLEKNVFSSGEWLRGQCNVVLNEDMKMRGLRLYIHGGANVHWTERHSTGSGKNRRTTTRHYRASEQYFNYEVVLFGKASGQSGDDPTLPAGSYSYPFQFQLPQQIPSSFEGAWGRVRYSVKGTIDRPWRFDHNTKAAFTVVTQLDLNATPQMTYPVQGNNSKTLCCLCCKSGPISATMRLDRQGYVPGECVRINGECSNQTTRKMDKSQVVLTQYIIFHATSKSRSQVQEVTKLTKGEIPPGETEVWNGDQLHIPPVPPSSLIYCNIIDLRYVVKMVVDPSGPAFDLEVPLTITIGTVPLHNMFQPYVPPPQAGIGFANYGPGPGQGPGPEPSAPPDYNSLSNVPPPPTYAECFSGKVDIKEEDDNEYTMGNTNWAPIYPYYGPPIANSGQPPPNGAYPPPNSGYPPPNSGPPPVGL